MSEDRQFGDLSGAQDGYGYEQVFTSFCPDGVPLEFALLSLLAAFGVAFGVLYVALTMGKRSLARDIDDEKEYDGDIIMFLGSQLADLLWSGTSVQSISSAHGNLTQQSVIFVLPGVARVHLLLTPQDKFLALPRTDDGKGVCCVLCSSSRIRVVCLLFPALRLEKLQVIDSLSTLISSKSCQ